MKTKSIIKRLILVSAILSAMTSCEKNEPIMPQVRQSDVYPSISYTSSKTGFFDVSYDDQCTKADMDIGLVSNIPVISASSDRYSSGHGFALNGDMNSYIFSWGRNGGYTVDCGFSFVQSIWEPVWIEYSSYGYVEKNVNFRVRGALGTQYLNLADPELYKGGIRYYLKGKVVAVSDITTGTEQFETVEMYSNYFRDMSYTPEKTYTAEYVTLTINTLEGDVDITVCGMRRDQEIDSLLNYVNIGSVIEVPIKLDSSISVAKEEIRQRSFHQILPCEVFCVE